MTLEMEQPHRCIRRARYALQPRNFGAPAAFSPDRCVAGRKTSNEVQPHVSALGWWPVGWGTPGGCCWRCEPLLKLKAGCENRARVSNRLYRGKPRIEPRLNQNRSGSVNCPGFNG